MRFGGHETFTIREGWLHKGLKLLVEDPDLFLDAYVADWLGVGKNMAKSIQHWLIATKLADPVSVEKPTQKKGLEITKLGRLVWDRDRYFTSPGTWWAIHVNLVNNPVFAASWEWFFNSFHLDRFDRSLCIESLRRKLEMESKRTPSLRTLERDIGCLLACYCRTIPSVHVDPEDVKACPLVELSLVNHYRGSGYYQLNQGLKAVPPEIFGYAIATAFEEAVGRTGKTDIGLVQAAHASGGPGRCFLLTSEALFDLALLVARDCRKGDFEIAGLAGERVIRIRKQLPIKWLENFYIMEDKRERDAA